MHLDQFGDWDVVSRKTNRPILHLIWILLQIPAAAAPMDIHSSVTWTLRNRSTGETRCVTADSEIEAAERITAGKFDRRPRWRRGRIVPLIPRSE
jgi:hypothetical protein